jgi:hypothetical protein
VKFGNLEIRWFILHKKLQKITVIAQMIVNLKNIERYIILARNAIRGITTTNFFGDA